MNNLAYVRRVQRAWAARVSAGEAEGCAGDAETDLRARCSPPSITTSMNNLAAMHSELGQHKEALAMHKNVLKMQEDMYGSDAVRPGCRIDGQPSCHAQRAWAVRGGTGDV